jgi:hypothetical protein
MLKKFFLGGIIFLLFLTFFSSCLKDKFYKGTATLNFSVDTLRFDTVFTTIGSTTQYFKIYNPHSQKVRINHIFLQNGSASMFRLNVDGKMGSNQMNIDIAAHDSMYVFVIVTVNPNNQNNPIVVNDKIVIETNNNTQGVALQAWGQDVYIHRNSGYFKDRKDSIYFDATVGNGISSGVWKNDKPHLIFGVGIISGGSTVTFQQGTKIYMHNGAAFYVFGNMNANGTKQDSIVFQGDRLEHDYDNIPGQWEGIELLRGSVSSFTHTVFKNANTPINIGSDTSQNTAMFGNSNRPQVTLNKCIIKNSFTNSIFNLNGNVNATNCLIYGCNQQLVANYLGGVLNFKQCTLANFGSTFVSPQSEILKIADWFSFDGTNYIVNSTTTNFQNCIIFGDLQTNKEILFDAVSGTDSAFHYTFDHCLLRTDLNTNSSNFINCIVGNDDNDFAKFTNYISSDYTLQAISPAVNSGSASIGVLDDLNDKSRDAQPDMGCYER